MYVCVLCFILQTGTLVVTMPTGCGLMEIVTEPDMRCGVEAASFVRELQLLLQTIRFCDGNMQDGSLRVEANVLEVKNMNGLRFLSCAIGELHS